MNQGILNCPTSRPANAGRDDKLLDKLETIYRRNREKALRETSNKLETLRQELIAEKRDVLPPDLRRSIQNGMAICCDPRAPAFVINRLPRCAQTA